MFLRFDVSTAVPLAVLAVLAAAGCGSDAAAVRCGAGTVLNANTCVPEAAPGDGGAPDGAATALSFGGVAAVAPAGPTSLFVAWTPAAGRAPDRVRYRIFLGSADRPLDYAAPLVTTERGALAHHLAGLDTGKRYDIAVRALDDADHTEPNTVVKSASPAADAAPPAFAGVKAVQAAGSGAVELRWDAAQDDLTPPEALVYLVYVAHETATMDFSVPTLVTAPGATTVTVPRLFDSRAFYRFVVRARDAAENVEANDVTVTSRAGSDSTPPSFQGCKAAVADSAGSAIVSWEPATDDVTPLERLAYDVYAAPDGQPFDFAAPPSASTTNETSTRVLGLTPTTTWRFVCRARDFSGNTDRNSLPRLAKTLTDVTPPIFAGLENAEVDGIARTVDISWSAATDDKSLPEQMIYDVYEAVTSHGHDFQAPPRASSAPGATSIHVTDLAPDRTLYWVVRARDQGGSRDANTVQAQGSIGVSFARQVQPIFTQDCAVSGCHVPGNPVANLILSPGFAYSALVNVPAQEVPAELRVAPENPAGSYLYKKISQNPPPVGWQMPAPATGSTLTEQEKDLVRRWILQGSANN